MSLISPIFDVKGDGNPDDYYVLINREFWYQFYLNRLKNVEVVGVWIFANGLMEAAIL